MKSDVATVEAYLQEAPAVRRTVLREMRRLARDLLTDHEERMQYGMASYARNETVDFAFASQSKYISLYVMKQDVVAAHAEQLTGMDIGKGCIRFRSAEQIDLDLVASLLRATHESAEPPC